MPACCAAPPHRRRAQVLEGLNEQRRLADYVSELRNLQVGSFVTGVHNTPHVRCATLQNSLRDAEALFSAVPDLSAPPRRLIRSGVMLKRRLYLLSDLLLWTTPDLSFRGFMPINEGTAVEGAEEGGRLLIKVA